jgi:hypothetical protein
MSRGARIEASGTKLAVLRRAAAVNSPSVSSAYPAI